MKSEFIFDESIGSGVRTLVSTATMLIESLESGESVKKRSPELTSEINQNIKNLLNDNFHPVMNRLENMFKAFLASESARDLPLNLSPYIPVLTAANYKRVKS